MVRQDVIIIKPVAFYYNLLNTIHLNNLDSYDYIHQSIYISPYFQIQVWCPLTLRKKCPFMLFRLAAHHSVFITKVGCVLWHLINLWVHSWAKRLNMLPHKTLSCTPLLRLLHSHTPVPQSFLHTIYPSLMQSTQHFHTS